VLYGNYVLLPKKGEAFSLFCSFSFSLFLFHPFSAVLFSLVIGLCFFAACFLFTFFFRELALTRPGGLCFMDRAGLGSRWGGIDEFTLNCLIIITNASLGKQTKSEKKNLEERCLRYV